MACQVISYPWMDFDPPEDQNKYVLKSEILEYLNEVEQEKFVLNGARNEDRQSAISETVKLIRRKIISM